MAVSLLANRRVELAVAPPRRGPPPLSAVLVGHCPGRHRLTALTAEGVEGLDLAGFHRLAARVRRRQAGDLTADPDPAIAARFAEPGDATHLPLTFTSHAAFLAVFPEAGTALVRHQRPLCGPGSWLARAVADFFAGGGERCHVVAVPEEDGSRAFLPGSPATVRAHAAEPERLRGLELLLVLPEAGLLLTPDLERLAIPRDLVDPGAADPPPPPPEFQPCGAGDPPRARRSEFPAEPAPLPPGEAIAPIAGLLAAFRPDLQWLCTLPLASRLRAGEIRPAAEVQPGLDPAARRLLAAAAADERLARVLEPLWPYLRDADGTLRSPAGVVAGAIAGVARREGAWRSVAGRPLASLARPFPTVDLAQAAELREAAMISVLVTPAGQLELDDERSPSAVCAYSAEAARFLGWLRRRLERLGERLVFTADPRDPAPLIAISQDLDRLRALGALDGGPGLPAYTVRPGAGDPEQGQLVIDIEIVPALPIDVVRLALLGNDGRWTLEERRA